MSIVFINYPLETFTPTSSGALATIIWECCKLASNRDVKPHVITRSSSAERFPWPHTTAIDYPSLPSNPVAVRALRAQRKITGWRHLRHRAYAVRVARALARQNLHKRPMVLINDPETAVFLRRVFPKSFIMHWFENQMPSSPRVRREFANSANVVAGVSNFTARWIREYYQLSSVETLYNGVDVEKFAPPRRSEDDCPVIGFVGRTGIEKAPDLLLKAALKVSKKTKDFSIQLIGSNHWDKFEVDDYQRELQGLAEALGAIGISVARPGHVGRADLPAQMGKAQIHVVPSRWDEPFGLTTLEGMATGQAVVASNTGGTPEVVGDAGLLFGRDSVDELAGHLLTLLEDPVKRAEYASKARERACEFTWERTWRGVLSLTGVE